MKQFVISPSPHIHSGDSVEKNMYRVLIALMPAFLVSIIYFGVGALVVTVISVLGCVLTEYIIQRAMKVPITVFDGSAAITGLLLAFNLPANLPWWIVIIGAVFSIGVVKMSFGGLGRNIFNPAIAGRVFLLMSFPVQMTSWPKPRIFNFTFADIETGATPLALIKEAAKEGRLEEVTNCLGMFVDMFVGEIGGSLGEVSSIALLIGGIYLIWKKVITWHIPVFILLTVTLFSSILTLYDSSIYIGPVFHIFSGGMLLGAIYMATDYVTSPMSKKGMVVYGIGVGLIAILIRVYGSYPEGISFAILIMNAVTPLINVYLKPKRFGHSKPVKS